ncbi:hypothetical protein TsFJ059_003425 [Trichoderma semiorbis]|uniref:Uncharacterized protein n=1 Tax=Trichoderma semiorbis TaxID=1491008 RepID=A0A9P8HRF7_9HYPO|nr:hypothetical protein TsFJ059_003425 [Trichoderma semiorbis]
MIVKLLAIGIEHFAPLVKQLTFEYKFTTIIFKLIRWPLVLMPYMDMCINEDRSSKWEHLINRLRSSYILPVNTGTFIAPNLRVNFVGIMLKRR